MQAKNIRRVGIGLLGFAICVGITIRFMQTLDYNRLMLEWIRLPHNPPETRLLGPAILDNPSRSRFQSIGQELNRICLSQSSFQSSACMRASMIEIMSVVDDKTSILTKLQRFPAASFEQIVLAAFAGDVLYRLGDEKISLYLWQSYLPSGMRIQRAIAAARENNFGLTSMLVDSVGRGSLPQSLGERLELVKPIETLAMKSMTVGDAKSAETYWRWAIELFPDRSVYYSGLGSALSEQGRYEDAVGAYEQAIQIDSDNALYLVGLANVYLKYGDPDLALEAVKRALRLDPENLAAHDLMRLLH